MTDGDGLTYRVLLRSGGFSDAVCAKQVCILKTPQREKVNKPRLTYLSGSGVSLDRLKEVAHYILFFSSLYGCKFVVVTSFGRDTTLECFHSSRLAVDK